eukprot:gene16538-biopygen746
MAAVAAAPPLAPPFAVPRSAKACVTDAPRTNQAELGRTKPNQIQHPSSGSSGLTTQRDTPDSPEGIPKAANIYMRQSQSKRGNQAQPKANPIHPQATRHKPTHTSMAVKNS